MASCNQPACRGVDHLGLCHLCPHDGDAGLAGLPYAAHPCSRCKAGDSREQGHGRGMSYEAMPPKLVAEAEADMPSLFDGDQPPPPQQFIVAILHALCQLKPREYITLIESVRTRPDGGPRALKDISNAVKVIIHEREVSFQLTDMVLDAAMRKLAEGSRIASGALGLPGGVGTRAEGSRRACGAHGERRG